MILILQRPLLPQDEELQPVFFLKNQGRNRAVGLRSLKVYDYIATQVKRVKPELGQCMLFAKLFIKKM